MKSSRRQRVIAFFVLLILAAGAVGYGLLARRNSLLQEYPGYRLYSARALFYVLVDKDFPSNESFLFVTKKRPVVFAFDQSKEDTGRASISVGTGLSAHVVTDRENKPSELWLMKRMQDAHELILQDIDLNGTWDVKIMFKQRFIYLSDTWLEVDKVSGSAKIPRDAALGDHTYQFNRVKGIWEERSVAP